MKEMIPLIPFIFELLLDFFLIKWNKKDLPLWLRVILIGLCSTETLWVLTIPPSNLCLAVAPFVWFDIALNKLRKKRWDYVSTTNGKAWEKFIIRFDPYKFLLVRCFVAGIIIGGYVVLKNNGL
jgi:hypothetical protein